ncbi:unnamed protein product [Scytosiphon promiscuus]
MPEGRMPPAQGTLGGSWRGAGAHQRADGGRPRGYGAGARARVAGMEAKRTKMRYTIVSEKPRASRGCGRRGS